MVRKRYRPDQRGQVYLFPPSADEWVPKGHLVFFIRDLLDELDLSPIEELIHAKDPRGERPYDPRVMLGILLLGYCLGIYSSRKLEQATINQVAFRVLAGDARPHFTTVNTFRKNHRDAISALFMGVLLICQEAGLVELGHVAVDGTKIKASASKHKAKSYERLSAEEQKLMAQIQELLDRSEDEDCQEDEKYGEGRRAFELPEELQERRGRREKLRAMQARIEQRARLARAAVLREQAAGQRENAETENDPSERERKLTRAAKSEAQAETLDPHDDDPDEGPPAGPSTDLPRRRMRHKPDGTPHPKAQMSPTDPDSHLMKGSNGGFEQAYNAQAVVDGRAQIIIAADVTDQPPDSHNLEPMLEQARRNCGRAPDLATADSGYWNDDVAETGRRMGTKILVALSRESGAKDRQESAETTAARQQMAEALKLPDNKKAYARRKAIVEPVFGQIKHTRGFRQFMVRGIDAVRAEWTLLATCHNILKLYRANQAAQPA